MATSSNLKLIYTDYILPCVLLLGLKGRAQLLGSLYKTTTTAGNISVTSWHNLVPADGRLLVTFVTTARGLPEDSAMVPVYTWAGGAAMA
jgi:hypothetical protein